MRRRGVLVASALALSVAVGGSSASAAAPVRLRVYNVHTHERATLVVPTFGRLPELQYRRAKRIWRSWRTQRRRPVHPRLLRTLARIQRRFDGATIELLSGFRVPENRDRLSSYHQVGRAADIRLRGVAKDDLYRYCRELQRERALGCGYYPRGTFIHIDIRSRSGVWVDLSAPNQPKRYVRDARGWLARRGL